MDREDQGASGRDPDDDWAGNVDGEGLRGWISPDDRLWRHPSEASGPAPAPVPPAGAPDADPAPRGRAGTWIVGGAAACFVLALVAAGLMVATTGGSEDDGAVTAPSHIRLSSAPTTELGAGRMAGPAAVDAMVDAVAPSTVELRVTGSHGVAVITGLVAESGGIIVTAAGALAGERSIIVTEADGTRTAGDLVASDPGSGLAVVRIADDLPAATFGDTDPAVGKMALAVSLDPPSRQGTVPATRVYGGAVTSTGQTTADGLDDIAVATPLDAEDVGCPLVDSGGEVTGVLETVDRSGESVQSVFVPAQLVLGVVNQLVDFGQVEHGWLGIEVSNVRTTTTAVTRGATAPASEGATLDTFLPGSPAASSGMVVGDVIVALDGAPVRSITDLRTKLYADAPGKTVEIDYHDPTTGTQTTWVTLGTGSGADAPVLSSSP